MIVIKLKCSKEIREKFKKHKIDKRKLENYLMFVTNNLVPTRKWWDYEIVVKGCKGHDSQYFWGEDEIEVATMCHECTSPKERRAFFIKSLVHEYRHWVQSQVQGISERHINYSEKDVDDRNDKYVKNKLELECAEWEVLVERFIDLV